MGAHAPTACRRVETARGHDAVHVRMRQQRLAPRVEDAEKAECGAEVLRRPGDLEERRCARVEEQVVDHAFVLQGQPGEGVRQGEDDVGVPDRQQLAFALGEPLVARVRQALGAVPIATRVEGDGAMPAGGTPIEMPAQDRGPAVRDGAEHTQVLRRQPGAMGLDETCAVLANDVGHLEGWPGHRFWSRRERRAVSGAETGIVSSGFVTAYRCRRDRCR